MNKLDIDSVYINFWGKPKPKFTELELAIMEGGNSLEEHYESDNTSISNNASGMQFIKGLLSEQVGRKPK